MAEIESAEEYAAAQDAFRVTDGGFYEHFEAGWLAGREYERTRTRLDGEIEREG